MDTTRLNKNQRVTNPGRWFRMVDGGKKVERNFARGRYCYDIKARGLTFFLHPSVHWIEAGERAANVGVSVCFARLAKVRFARRRRLAFWKWSVGHGVPTYVLGWHVCERVSQVQWYIHVYECVYNAKKERKRFRRRRQRRRSSIGLFRFRFGCQRRSKRRTCFRRMLGMCMRGYGHVHFVKVAFFSFSAWRWIVDGWILREGAFIISNRAHSHTHTHTHIHMDSPAERVVGRTSRVHTCIAVYRGRSRGQQPTRPHEVGTRWVGRIVKRVDRGKSRTTKNNSNTCIIHDHSQYGQERIRISYRASRWTNRRMKDEWSHFGTNQRSWKFGKAPLVKSPPRFEVVQRDTYLTS